jgi:hypothetical protein
MGIVKLLIGVWYKITWMCKFVLKSNDDISRNSALDILIKNGTKESS